MLRRIADFFTGLGHECEWQDERFGVRSCECGRRQFLFQDMVLSTKRPPLHWEDVSPYADTRAHRAWMRRMDFRGTAARLARLRRVKAEGGNRDG